MTRAQSAKLGGAVANQRAIARRMEFIAALDTGMSVKAAAYVAGVSWRTASRYRSGLTGVAL